MRLASPLTKPIPIPARVRGGPDWLAFVGNWMTEWERTGDTKYRDKIIAGMDSIADHAVRLSDRAESALRLRSGDR